MSRFKYLRKIVVGFVLLCLAAMVIYINLATFRNIPNVVEFHSQDPEISQMQQADIERFQLENELMLTYCAVEQKNIATLSGQKALVTAIYTDKYYKELYPVQMLSGNFFAAEDELVISQQLAESLFSTADAVGYRITLSGESYRISGVYKEDQSIMARSFGSPRVFVPIKADMPLDMLSFEGSRTAGYYRSLFSKDAAYKMSGYSDVNILQEANIVKLLNRILLVISAAIFFMKLSKIALARYRKMQGTVQDSLEDQYAFKAIKCNWKQVFFFILPVGICVVVLAVTLLVLAKPLPLRLDMMVGNLFDLTAYYDILLDRIAMPNGFLCPQAAYYLRYSQISVMVYLGTIAVVPLALLVFGRSVGRSCRNCGGENE